MEQPSKLEQDVATIRAAVVFIAVAIAVGIGAAFIAAVSQL